MGTEAKIALWTDLRGRFERLDYSAKSPPEIRAEGKNGGTRNRARLTLSECHRAFETLAIMAGQSLPSSIDSDAYATGAAERWFEVLLQFFGDSDHVPATDRNEDGTENPVILDFWFVHDALSASVRACDRIIGELRHAKPKEPVPLAAEGQEPGKPPADERLT